MYNLNNRILTNQYIFKVKYYKQIQAAKQCKAKRYMKPIFKAFQNYNG